jgi:hypothetical protein
MAKMYYTEAQACDRLKVDSARLMDMVRRGQLHAYADGPNKMFKVAEVDSLAGPREAGTSSGESDIQLAPVDSGTHETISLSDTNTGGQPSKDASGTRSGTSGGSRAGTLSLSDSGIRLTDTNSGMGISDSGSKSASASGLRLSDSTHGLSDSGAHSLSDSNTRGPSDSGAHSPKSDTVITSEGISIFDDEDLEIEAADPMAKTQIAPGLDEQIGGEGASAGSGLLDLTREKDDTSLGADVIGRIDMESGDAASASVQGVADSIPNEPEAAPAGPPAAVDSYDPTAAPFAGLAVGTTLVLLLLGGIAAAMISGARPDFVELLGSKLLYVIGGAVAAVAAAAGLGAFLGKKTARPPAK